MITLFDAMKDAVERFVAAEIEDPWANAAYLVQFLLKIEDLGDQAEVVLSDANYERFSGWVTQRVARYPAQYITGRQKFCDRWFSVNPNVHIPRTYTEEFVNNLLKYLVEAEIVVEIGTGAGAVGLTIAQDARPKLVLLTDLTEDVIRVAQANASSLGIPSRQLRFLVGAGLEPLQRQRLRGKVRAILSNPPDLSSLEISSVAPEAKFEPPMSLSSGSEEPLKIHKEIVDGSIGYLLPSGIIGFHVRPKYANELAEYMREHGFEVREIEGTEPMYPVTLIGEISSNKSV